MMDVTVGDYAVNILLVASVLRQLRGRHLTWFGLGWPIAVVIAAAFGYLRGVPTTGGNITLVLFGAFAGATLGALCGLLSRVYRANDGQIVVRATGLVAALWVLGTGSRLAFELYAEHGGYPSIRSFDAAHRITSTQTWATCLIVMALAEVLLRTAILAPRLTATQRHWPSRDAPHQDGI
jgi:hypothetical protein